MRPNWMVCDESVESATPGTFGQQAMPRVIVSTLIPSIG